MILKCENDLATVQQAMPETQFRSQLYPLLNLITRPAFESRTYGDEIEDQLDRRIRAAIRRVWFS